MLFNPYLMLAGVILWLVTAIASFFYGEHVEALEWKAKEAEVAQQVQKEKDAADELGRALVKQIQQAQLERDIAYKKLQGKINEATDGRVCFANTDALSLWNQSLGQNGMPPAPTGASKGATGASATDREVLANAAENFKQYIDCRAAYNALKHWNETKGMGKR